MSQDSSTRSTGSSAPQVPAIPSTARVRCPPSPGLSDTSRTPAHLLRQSAVVMGFLATAILGTLLGCGASPKKTSVVSNGEFVCNGRRAEVVVTGGLLYAEQGIRLRCDDDKPRAEKYVIQDDGQTLRKEAPMEEGAWEDSWRQLEAAGWRNANDCETNDETPIFTFEIADGDNERTMVCAGKELPFPFDRLRNTLDLAAGNITIDKIDE
ncbi:MAG: hypothetical protein V2A73_02995 [Pseudomonadota bacterium]